MLNEGNRRYIILTMADKSNPVDCTDPRKAVILAKELREETYFGMVAVSLGEYDEEERILLKDLDSDFVVESFSTDADIEEVEKELINQNQRILDEL